MRRRYIYVFIYLSTRIVLKLSLSSTCQTCSQQLCARVLSAGALREYLLMNFCFSLFCLQIRIRSCVHLLLFITLGVHSSKFDVNPVTDDISRLSILVRMPLGRRSHPRHKLWNENEAWMSLSRLHPAFAFTYSDFEGLGIPGSSGMKGLGWPSAQPSAWGQRSHR